MARKPQDGDILDNVAPKSLEEATGSSAGTAIAIRENALEEVQLPVNLGGFTSAPILSAKDVQMPNLRLAQGLTSEVQDGTARPGQWLLPGEEGSETYTLIPLYMQAGRELRDASDGGKLNCHSDDRVLGVGDPGGSCDVCPFAEWTDVTDAKTGEVKRRPPACAVTYRYICYVEEADTLAILTFKRTSYNTGKKVNAFIQSKGLGHFAMTLGATKNSGKSGTYYSPTVATAKVSDNLLDYARSLVAR